MDKLYGIAAAAIPIDDGKGVTVYCTPIAVPRGNRAHFEILEKYKTVVHWDNQEERRACFVKLVDMLDKIVELQKDSCKKMGVEYRKVSLYVGQMRKKPVRPNKVYDAAFCEPFQKPESIKKVEESPAWTSWVEKVAPEDIQQKPELLSYVNACRKLPDLLKECTWKDGSYATLGMSSHISLVAKQSKLDTDLIGWKEKIDKGEDTGHIAHNAIIDEAREYGKNCGARVRENPYLFSTDSPKGYRESIEAQTKFPSLGAYFEWHPDYKKAFYEEFAKEYGQYATHGVYRHYKLPMDTANPPFTDPCADRIVEQFQVIDKIRPETHVEEFKQFPEIKRKLEALASGAADKNKMAQWEAEIATDVLKVHEKFSDNTQWNDFIKFHLPWYKEMHAKATKASPTDPGVKKLERDIIRMARIYGAEGEDLNYDTAIKFLENREKELPERPDLGEYVVRILDEERQRKAGKLPTSGVGGQ